MGVTVCFATTTSLFSNKNYHFILEQTLFKTPRERQSIKFKQKVKHGL